MNECVNDYSTKAVSRSGACGTLHRGLAE